MAAVSLTTLRARVREAADAVNSSFVTDTANSLDAFINAAAEELYKLLVTRFEDYFEPIAASLSLVSGTQSYDLPADFLKLRGVDIQVGENWFSLKPAPFSKRNYQNARAPADLRFLRYQLRGTKLWFIPSPSQSATARAYYVPQFARYVDDADAFEWYGWEEVIVQRAAAKVAVKEETDPSPYMAEAARLEKKIEEEASNRDATEPASVGDADDYLAEGYPWLLQ